MSVIGIISEFNPFHNGHKYLIDCVKNEGDSVVCVMSGNFVQRGEPAVADKRIRAKAALLCGADLIIELPVAFSAAGAQTFARGGVKLLDSLGTVDTIAFGSECGKLSDLEKAVNALENKAVYSKISDLMQTGITFAAAREKAVEKIYGGETANILKNPNDILAVEYISALKVLKSEIKPCAVKREGASHDGAESDGAFASAALIRKMMQNGEDISKYMPQKAFEVFQSAVNNGYLPADYKKLDTAVLAFLRKSSPEDFKGIPDVSEGIENRIIAASRTADTLSEVFDGAKTKRYTHARIRRIVLCGFLRIKNTYIECGMPYIHILGFNDRGRALLHSAAEKSTLPIAVRNSDFSRLGDIANMNFKLECTATDIFNLTLPKIRPCGTEMTDGPVIL